MKKLQADKDQDCEDRDEEDVGEVEQLEVILDRLLRYRHVELLINFFTHLIKIAHLVNKVGLQELSIVLHLPQQCIFLEVERRLILVPPQP